MFSYIKGTLEEYWEDTIVVESGGIGWNIHVPLSVLDRLPHVGEQIKVYTSFQVKEDSMTLYGFFSRQDLKMFKQLLGVNGIGPKGALGLLSAMRPDDLRLAVISGDAKAISATPGIGKKTAEKLILELKDKLNIEDMLEHAAHGGDSEDLASGTDTASNTMQAEAVQALTALGYGSAESLRAVKKSSPECSSVEDILKEALKFLL